MKKNELVNLICSELKLRTVPQDLSMGKVFGWDSLSHIMLLMSLEKSLNIKIPLDMYGKLTSVDQIALYLISVGIEIEG